jgi:hypothetical protein
MQKKPKAILGGEFIHMRCAAHHSTYLMLSIAKKYQKAFDLLGKDDGHLFVSSITDWENCRTLVNFLQVFYDAMLKFLSKC